MEITCELWFSSRVVLEILKFLFLSFRLRCFQVFVRSAVVTRCSMSLHSCVSLIVICLIDWLIDWLLYLTKRTFLMYLCAVVETRMTPCQPEKMPSGNMRGSRVFSSIFSGWNGVIRVSLSQHRDTKAMFYLFYKIASVLHRISLDERHFLSEYRETFDVIFMLYQSTETQISAFQKPAFLS